MGLECSMDIPSLSDDDLALALQAGELRAFDELVRRHQQRVYAVAYRITTNREDARDVAQEALLRAYRRIHQWRPGAGFVPWLMRLTANASIDHVRREKRRPRSLSSADDDGFVHRDQSAPAVGNPASRSHATEIARRVDAALKVLSPSQRAVFAMRHYEGMKLNEIAEAMECSVGSVKVHLFRALRKLQTELQELWDDATG
jgi:RNA polymerase sigma-70 factor (ECF subfamily)